MTLSTAHVDTSTLVFLRRQQVADLIVDLSFNPASRPHASEWKGLLIDALHQLPPQCFIADDWSCILHQVIQALRRHQEQHVDWGMPAPLIGAIGQLEQRLQ